MESLRFILPQSEIPATPERVGVFFHLPDLG
jgi:hypothetical protein